LEEMEQERMDRLVFGGQQAVKRFQPKTTSTQASPPEKTTSSPRTWAPLPYKSPSTSQPQQTQTAAPRKWEQKQQQDQGAKLDGNMDLSTRINYLNSLLDQGSITEDEYAVRTEPIRVASEIINSCISSDTAALKTVLAQNPKFDVDSIVENGATPLSVAIAAVSNGQAQTSEIVRLLLQHGAQPDRRTSGNTALMTLCNNAGRTKFATECARLLIQSGADARANQGTSTCLSGAASSGGTADLIELLCQSGASARDEVEGIPVLNYCIIEGKTAQAIALIKYGADTNSREPDKGATCLASAIFNGHLDVVKALLDRGANVSLNIMRDQDMTAKDLAQHLASQGGVHAQIGSLVR